MRACVQLVASRLPAEARGWLASADAYERGALSADALTALRVRAWRLHDARSGDADGAELSALRVVIYRLFPDQVGDDWYESAWQFLHFCNDAGLGDELLLGLLREHFADVLGEAGSPSRRREGPHVSG